MQTLSQKAAARVRRPNDFDGLVDVYSATQAKYTGAGYMIFENGIPISDIITMPEMDKNYTESALAKLKFDFDKLSADAARHEARAKELEEKKRFAESTHFYSAAQSSAGRAEGIKQTLEMRRANMDNVINQYCNELDDYVKEIQRIFIDPAVEIVKSLHTDPDGKKRKAAAAV